MTAAVAVAIALATPFGGRATAQDSTHAASRLIGIFDVRTGNPLGGVLVVDALSGTYAVTTATGTARLDFLTFRGTATFVELRKLGYQPKEVLVSRTDTVSITEVMEPFVELAPVVSTERYRIDRDPGLWSGFETRCQSKSVTCIRNDQIEKRPSANLADFLIHAVGIVIGSCGGGSRLGSAGRNGQCGKIAMRGVVIPPAFCQPTFFIDGFEWSPSIGAPADLVPGRPPEAPYTPSNVKAMEVYPPERVRPLRFAGDPTCGAIVMWTK
jgi:hypothetical protein